MTRYTPPVQEDPWEGVKMLGGLGLMAISLGLLVVLLWWAWSGFPKWWQ